MVMHSLAAFLTGRLYLWAKPAALFISSQTSGLTPDISHLTY